MSLNVRAAALALSLGLAWSVSSSFPCRYPPPAANFSANTYTGTWYEIGRTQTKGGGFFQRNCVCTQLVVGPYAPGGDAAVENACREKTPSGKLQVFNATLSHQSPPGHWLETPPPSGVNYTVIEIGSDYSVEYDCREDSLLGPQYCIHILSRTPTMDVDLQSTLLSRAYAMGLNPENISFAKTVQDGCW